MRNMVPAWNIVVEARETPGNMKKEREHYQEVEFDWKHYSEVSPYQGRYEAHEQCDDCSRNPSEIHRYDTSEGDAQHASLHSSGHELQTLYHFLTSYRWAKPNVALLFSDIARR